MPQTRTLFLLSGLLCDESVWDGMKTLGDIAEVRPVAFPGYDSIPAMAGKVLAEAPPERFAVAGHSMGGASRSKSWRGRRSASRGWRS